MQELYVFLEPSSDDVILEIYLTREEVLDYYLDYHSVSCKVKGLESTEEDAIAAFTLVKWAYIIETGVYHSIQTKRKRLNYNQWRTNENSN